MVRIVLGVIVGFFGWGIMWFGAERILSAISPEWFGTQQRSFQEAIEHGGQFTADSSFLLTHIVIGSIVSVISGFLAALVAGENKRATFVLGVLLVAFGLLKAVMSWQYVPLWYHIIFTAILLPMTVVGGKLRNEA